MASRQEPRAVPFSTNPLVTRCSCGWLLPTVSIGTITAAQAALMDEVIVALQCPTCRRVHYSKSWQGAPS